VSEIENFPTSDDLDSLIRLGNDLRLQRDAALREVEALREVLIHVTRFSDQETIRSHCQHALDFFSVGRSARV
jgi:hypothetical protein